MDRISPGGAFEVYIHKQRHRQLSDRSRALTHKGAFYAQQQQQQQPPTQIQSFRPSLPVGSEMPDERGYPPSSTPQVSNVPFSESHVHGLHSLASLALTDKLRNTQGVVTLPTGSSPRGGVPQSHSTAGATAMVPTCRHPNCRHPVSQDERTQELTEYCLLDHMRFVGPICTAPRAVCFFFFFALGAERSPIGLAPAVLYSGLVTPCALRVGGVLAALIAGSVGPSAKSGQCSSDDNENSNVSNKNTSSDTSSASTGNYRLWGNPQRSLIRCYHLEQHHTSRQQRNTGR